ncbi:hypothetical protein OESDEN_24955 [Oesophagostomum dentatum]|uniref:Uncharacterized protein n=1 Tax=Oesophagostomum dentatum TaxID=61180 RepID=A0A0B1RWJ7_OESDE|nr:hypothetical protein OESDEN_24955 [Oesophagostomum dentatum]
MLHSRVPESSTSGLNSKRKSKKKRNQLKNLAKIAKNVDDDGFNKPGYVHKPKKSKKFTKKIGKRTLAKTSAKVVKNKRKKLLARKTAGAGA